MAQNNPTYIRKTGRCVTCIHEEHEMDITPQWKILIWNENAHLWKLMDFMVLAPTLSKGWCIDVEEIYHQVYLLTLIINPRPPRKEAWVAIKSISFRNDEVIQPCWSLEYSRLFCPKKSMVFTPPLLLFCPPCSPWHLLNIPMKWARLSLQQQDVAVIIRKMF